jgi:glycine betaine/proline transport system substrate-binding protein
MRILMRSRGKIIIALLLVLSLSLVLLGCNSNNAQQSSGDPKDTPIRIGVNNWPENIAAANMWKILLEEKGYKVELISGEKAPIYTGVSSGDLELGLEVWLPLLDKPYYDQYKDKLETYGPWYNGARVGLLVPEYVDVNSIEELNDNKDKFLVNGTPTIVGIDAGASIMKETAGAIEKYNLDYQLMNGSEAAMMAALKRAYDNNEPVAVTHWTPHWAFSVYDLKFLDDPRKAYSDPDDIYIMATKGFGEKYPNLVKWLDQWHMDDDTLGGLMATIQDAGDPAKGAKDWIEKNRGLVDEWLK